MRKSLISLLLILLFFSNTQAQLGGKAVYRFLDLPFSARLSSLGSSFVPVIDKDVTLGMTNPSLINEKMANHLNFSITNYFTDITYGGFAYSRKIKGLDFLGGIRYINYGDFLRADEFGNTYGVFTAGEYAFQAGAAKLFGKNYRAGANLKFIYSSFEKFNSSGLAADLAVSYLSDNELFCASVVLDNLGFQLNSYSKGYNEPLPLNLQAGFSSKLEHMPLRLVVVAHHLNDLDFTYESPDKNSGIFGGETTTTGIPVSEKIFRHFNFGGEMVMSPNFFIRFSYNHQRRKELQISDYPGLTGYSWGFGLRISKFQISYGNAIYHVAGGSNQFSVTSNLADFYKKKKTQKGQ